MFKKETCVRKWLKNEVKRAFNKKVKWVEHRRGGTAGFPDSLVPYRGLLLPVELKCVTFLENNLIKNPLNLSQRANFREFLREKTKCMVLIGEKNGNRLFMADVRTVISSNRLALTEIKDIETALDNTENVFGKL